MEAVCQTDHSFWIEMYANIVREKYWLLSVMFGKLRNDWFKHFAVQDQQPHGRKKSRTITEWLGNLISMEIDCSYKFKPYEFLENQVMITKSVKYLFVILLFYFDNCTKIIC